jgi:deoxyribodipyrimidine photo-lyase
MALPGNTMDKINVFWFRRDLRLDDNAGLYHALKSGLPVLPIFIFDKDILDKLEDKQDRRVEFIHASLLEIQEQLLKIGSSLKVYFDTPLEAFKKLTSDYNIQKVFTNHDYEPYAIERDHNINGFLKSFNIAFHTSRIMCC